MTVRCAAVFREASCFFKSSLIFIFTTCTGFGSYFFAHLHPHRTPLGPLRAPHTTAAFEAGWRCLGQSPERFETPRKMIYFYFFLDIVTFFNVFKLIYRVT